MKTTGFRPYIIILNLFWCLISFSQRNFEISGMIYDYKSNTTLIGANIIALGSSGTVSGIDGSYSLSLSPEKYTIIVSFIGYENDTIQIELNKNITHNFYLKEKTIVLNSVELKGEKSNNILSDEIGTVTLTSKELKNVPTLLGEADIIKILELTPGVQSAKEGFTGMYIRGGGADQNLILLDDATIYNPTHLFGFFSVFNSGIVKDVSLTKAGMPAQFGGRLASVLEVKTHDGNYNKLKTNTDIGLISSKAMVEGPILKDKCSFIFSARRTYVDILLKPFKKRLEESSNFFATSLYYFVDFNGKISIKPNRNNIITLTGYYGKDNYYFNRSKYSFTTDIIWGNNLGSISWRHAFNDYFYWINSLSITNYHFSFKGKQNNYGYTLNSEIRDINYKNKFTFFYNRHLLVFGAEYINHHVIPNEQYAKLNRNTVDFSDRNKYNSHEIGIFINDKFSINNLKLNIGFRYSSYYQSGPFKKYIIDYRNEIIDSIIRTKGEILSCYNNIEPRLSLRWLLNKNSSLKFAFTQNYQYIHIAPVSTVSLPTDIWMPSTKKIKPQLGRHYSAGYYRNMIDDMAEVSFELYYKAMQNQIEFKRGIIDSEYEVVEDQLSFGKGESYGAELLIKKGIGNHNGWIGYTLAKTLRQFDAINNGEPFYAKYDRRHDLSLVYNYKINENIRFSSVFVFASGNALTLPTSRYLIQGFIINKYSGVNTFRMPPYHRLDISFTYNLKKSANSSLNFSIYNLYNRKNPYYIYFEVVGSVEENSLSVSPQVVSLFPILPSISWHKSF